MREGYEPPPDWRFFSSGLPGRLVGCRAAVRLRIHLAVPSPDDFAMPAPPGAFVWMELATRDADAALAFYTGLLGWTAASADLGGITYHTLQNGDDAMGGLFGMTEEWGDMASHWMPYIAVDDLDAALGRVRALGGTVHFGPLDAPHIGRFALMEDPTGAKVSLVECA